jgi:hypothetical protein
MIVIDLNIPRGAYFSPDRRYRYALWRVWSSVRPPLLFIGLNPSTANELQDDATITRLMKRADRAGFGGLLAANLYAYVSSDPEVLLQAGDHIGPENDSFLRHLVKLSGRVLCGWGSFAPAKNRAGEVIGMIPEPYCLGINADGQPKHPLYVGYQFPMIRYPNIYKERTQ